MNEQERQEQKGPMPRPDTWAHHMGDAPADAPPSRRCRGRCCDHVLCTTCGAPAGDPCLTEKPSSS